MADQNPTPQNGNPPATLTLDAPVPNASNTQGVKPDGGILGQAAMGALKSATPPPQTLTLDEPVQTEAEPTLDQLQAYARQLGLPVERAAGLAPAYKEAVAKQKISQQESAEGKFGEPQHGVIANTGIGVLKGVGQTVSGTASLLEKVPGVRDIPVIKNLATESQNGDYQQHGVAQNLGGGLESIGEFLAGDEVLKGLTVAKRLGLASKVAELAENSPRLKAALEVGMDAMRQGTVGGAQTLAHGGTAGEAAGVGAFTGTVSAAAGGLGMGMKAIYDAVASNSPEAISAALEGARQEGSNLADKIAGQSVGVQGDEGVIQALKDAKTQMSVDYTHGIANILKQMPDMPINLWKSPVQTVAKDILEKGGLQLPQETTAAFQAAIPEEMKAVQPLLKILTTGLGTGQGLTYTAEQFLDMRQAVGKIINDFGESSSVGRSMYRVKNAMDDTFETAAQEAGKPKIAKALQQTRAAYGEQLASFERNTIQKLAYGQPDAVANLIMGGQERIANAHALRSLIGIQNMNKVEGQMIKQMLLKSDVKGTFNPQVFIRSFNSLGPEVQKAFWGSELPQIQAFTNEISKLPLTEGGPYQRMAHYLEHRGTFGLIENAMGLVGAGAGGYEAYKHLGSLGTMGMVVAGAFLLHSPATLKVLTDIAASGAKVAVPVAAGAAQQIVSDSNQNTPTISDSHLHARASDGSEFLIPKEQVARAKEVDPGMQLLQQAGEDKNAG